ncbi:MAG: hypothetical protein WBO09_12225 [Methylocystis silviterrae]
MREFDAACLTTIEPLTGKQILALREREGVSQCVFARSERQEFPDGAAIGAARVRVTDVIDEEFPKACLCALAKSPNDHGRVG